MTTTRLLADGIFLNVDTCAKFINKESMLELIDKMRSYGKSNKDMEAMFDSSNPDLPRRTVITNYNTKSY